MLNLPEPEAVSRKVAAWSADDSALAALLSNGVPLIEALARRGLACLKESQATRGMELFRAALSLAPGDPVLWMNCGLAHDQSHLPAEARVCFEKSLALAPRQPEVWLLLGLARKKSGELIAAESAFREALALEPGLAIAWQCLALLKEEMKDQPAAIECLVNCLQHAGRTAPILANLGKLYFQQGKFLDAAAAFGGAAELDPANPHFREMRRKTRFLADALRECPFEEMVSAYRASFVAPETCADPALIDLFDKSMALLAGFGHLESARRLGRKRLDLWPGNTTAEYLVRAVSGEAGLDRSPSQFIVEHFDAKAETFESHLVRDLGYDVPRQLVAELRKLSASDRLFDTLDAGCGTGLCGPLLRPLSRVLVGVDLSPKMLEQAAKRELYDELACEELTGFLGRSPERFDLVVAADVLIYFGDLSPVFQAAAAALRPGGLLGFSTESGPEGGYQLQPSGRFAHAAGYIRAMAEDHFAEEQCVPTTLRHEANQPLGGILFVFRRR